MARERMSAIVLATVLFAASAAGCAAQREVVSDPVRFTRPLPVTVKKQAWPAIVETLIGEGEVIQTVHGTLGRVTFRRGLAETEFRKTCDTRSVTHIDVDTWRYMTGSVEVAVWLDGEAENTTPLQLIMEARCRARFDIPAVRRAVTAPWPIGLPALILFGSQMQPQTILAPSTGELERELQIKILTTLGVDLPPWLRREQ